MAEFTIEQWQAVPGEVARLYKEGHLIRDRARKALAGLSCDPAYGYVFYNFPEKRAWASLGPQDGLQAASWQAALQQADIGPVTVAPGQLPDNPSEWVMVKNAAWTDYVNPIPAAGKLYSGAGMLTGGPSPLTNGLVSGLLAGGLGYGAGTLMEYLFPERYVERGHLRKTLGLLGAGMGGMHGLFNTYANRANSEAAGQPMSFLQGVVTPNAAIPPNPEFAQARKNQAALSDALIKASAVLSRYPQPSALYKASATAFGEVYGAEPESYTGVALRAVPVDAFNNAIWNDVHNYQSSARYNPYGTRNVWGPAEQPMFTPPAVGSAASGMVSGIQQMYGGASVLSPRHFVNGLATAGVDLATAHVVGGVLGALGGLTPMAQEKLQDIGVWGGLMRGTVGSMLGLR